MFDEVILRQIFVRLILLFDLLLERSIMHLYYWLQILFDSAYQLVDFITP